MEKHNYPLEPLGFTHAHRKLTNKGWFRELWMQTPGYAEGEPVWRLEFQLSREAIRELSVDERKSRLDTARDVLGACRSIWKHLSRDWLSMRSPRRHGEKSRALTQTWAHLAEQAFRRALWAGTDCELYRHKRRRMGARSIAQIGADLTRLMAEHRYASDQPIDCEQGGKLIVDAVIRHYEDSGATLNERVEFYLDKMRVEGRLPVTSLPLGSAGRNPRERAMSDSLWLVGEVAAYLKMSKHWVYRAAANGVLPVIKVGASIRFDPERIRAWARGEPTSSKLVSLSTCRGTNAVRS